MKQEDLEKLVIQTTHKILCTKENIDTIADAVMKIHKKRMHDKSLLNILYSERDEAQRIIDNIMNAIEQGILTPTTKRRMEQAEEKLEKIKEKILIEQYNLQNQLKREEVVEYLTHTIQQSPQLMIHTLIKKIILYDDKIEIYYNYIDPIKPGGSSPNDDHRLFFIIDGSNLLHPAAPDRNSLNRSVPMTIRSPFDFERGSYFLLATQLQGDHIGGNFQSAAVLYIDIIIFRSRRDLHGTSSSVLGAVHRLPLGIHIQNVVFGVISDNFPDRNIFRNFNPRGLIFGGWLLFDQNQTVATLAKVIGKGVHFGHFQRALRLPVHKRVFQRHCGIQDGIPAFARRFDRKPVIFVAVQE